MLRVEHKRLDVVLYLCSTIGSMTATMTRREKVEYEQALLAEPETLDDLCALIADRRTLSEWCKAKSVRYMVAYNWLHDDKDRLSRYSKALEVRNAHLSDRVITGLVAISDADHRQAFDKKGKLLQPHQLPDSLVGAVAGIDIVTGERGERTTKLKLNDRGQAHERLGRHLGMFRDRLEVDMNHSFAAKLEAARQRVAKAKQKA